MVPTSSVPLDYARPSARQLAPRGKDFSAAAFIILSAISGLICAAYIVSLSLLWIICLLFHPSDLLPDIGDRVLASVVSLQIIALSYFFSRIAARSARRRMERADH
jgi:tellurite resistance protein TehA-like permease